MSLSRRRWKRARHLLWLNYRVTSPLAFRKFFAPLAAFNYQIWNSLIARPRSPTHREPQSSIKQSSNYRSLQVLLLFHLIDQQFIMSERNKIVIKYLCGSSYTATEKGATNIKKTLRARMLTEDENRYTRRNFPSKLICEYRSAISSHW